MAKSLILDDLRAEIAGGDVLVIAGTGVSVGATTSSVASWPGLILDGVERCVAIKPKLGAKWVSRRREDVESGNLNDLLAVAERVAEELGAPRGGEYRRWLRETVGALRAERREVIEALRDLGVTLATTLRQPHRGGHRAASGELARFVASRAGAAWR
ncbi:MAG: hypothetical protein M3373_12645 [Gemmatimonadota bacterium]|nr:hypothetical protein [Gemmatimonadota bacterium]